MRCGSGYGGKACGAGRVRGRELNGARLRVLKRCLRAAAGCGAARRRPPHAWSPRQNCASRPAIAENGRRTAPFSDDRGRRRAVRRWIVVVAVADRTSAPQVVCSLAVRSKNYPPGRKGVRPRYGRDSEVLVEPSQGRGVLDWDPTWARTPGFFFAARRMHRRMVLDLSTFRAASAHACAARAIRLTYHPNFSAEVAESLGRFADPHCPPGTG